MLTFALNEHDLGGTCFGLWTVAALLLLLLLLLYTYLYQYHIYLVRIILVQQYLIYVWSLLFCGLRLARKI